jgi:cytochrome c peroxidase
MRFIAVLFFATMFLPATVASPESDYMIHCMGCHMSDGQGMPPEVPAFNQILGDIVSRPGGRGYLIRVPGASQSPLSDERLASVLTWVLREYSGADLPDDFQDISLSEVRRFRPVTMKNPGAAREMLLAD